MLGTLHYSSFNASKLTLTREANLDTIQNSCQVEGWGENNSEDEIQAIKDSISGESDSTGIPRVGQASSYSIR